MPTIEGILRLILISPSSDRGVIDKFNYFCEQLVGRARNTVAGIALTEANYNNATEFLIELPGNDQILMSAQTNVNKENFRYSHN